MDAKYVNDFPDATQLLTAKDALNKLAEIEILIDVISTRLVECRKLRLDAITSDEIRNLERKLIKHFSQQLNAKQRVDPKESLSDLHRYPSLSNLLTLAGVSTSLIIAMKKQMYLVEDLLGLTALKLDSTVRDLGGSTEDTEKLFSALSVLRKFNGSFDGTNHSSRNGSESSGSYCSDAFSPSGRIHLDFPNATEHGGGSRRQHSTEIPSTSSSSTTPPSPTSHSSVESDSAFASLRGQGSPPAKIAMHVIPSTPSFAPPTPNTPGTPRKVSQEHLQPSFIEFQPCSKNLSRDRFPSTGAKTTFSTSVPKLKSSLSTECYLGNPKEGLTFGFGGMSGSCQSLGSNASHPSPSISKQTKANKKKNKRPILTVDTEKLDFISLSRTSRRGSSTISPEGLESPSPISGSRTPSTPLTPDLVGHHHDFPSGQPSLPGTPKTSKAKFKTVKKLFDMIRIGKKIKRNKSTEHLADSADQLPPVQRKRSGTMPSPKTNMHLRHNKLPASHPSSTCGTPLASPDLLLSLINHDPDSPSRRPSLVDTDKTIVPDDDDLDRDSTLVDGEEANDLPDDHASTLFRNESIKQSEEWDIHYDDLELKDKIGSGLVGTVYRGYWHGDVAIRVIDININDEEKLEAFKKEIGVFKKTRHENLELFMGSCVNPPHLAIVTGFCRGQSLYNFIRENKSSTSSVNQVKIIAQHIVQGMGYLHSKEIVHKDLKSKNIFVDGKRVVITGFGLVGLKAVARDNRLASGFLKIPEGWLCYLAPELIRSLTIPCSHADDVVSTLPYTTMTDVYAFGTVWYELLAGSWPLHGFPSESIIWQVGSDDRTNINQVQCVKDVKDLLHQCWSFNASQRPDFRDKGVMGCLKHLQTQMQRSLSSHPRRAGAGRGHPIGMERIYDGSHLRQATHFSNLHDVAE